MDISFGFIPQTFFLVLARVIGIFETVPLYGGQRIPQIIRVALSLMIAMILTPLVPLSWATTAGGINTLFGIIVGVLGELILGASVGMICLLFISVFVAGGEFIAQSAGLLMAQEVDPSSGISTTMISHLLQTIFILIVVLNNGHLVLLKLIADSFYSVPPQLSWINQGLLDGLISLCSSMYAWGLTFAAPIVAVILTLDVGFALIARIAPDVDILFMSIPVRLGLSLVVFGFILKLGASYFTLIGQRMLEACAALLS